MNATTGASLDYALSWRVRGRQPGAHRSASSGRGGRFVDCVPFERNPDPRRIDLRQSLRDPWQRLYVRQFEDRVLLRVQLLVDGSASMAQADVAGPVADLCEAVTAAARQLGDHCGLVVASNRLRFERRAARSALPIGAARRALQAHGPEGRGIDALHEAATRLSGRRLVLLVSDFAFDAARIERLFSALSAHDVVPIVAGAAEPDPLPRWGLAQMLDRETGQRRLLWLRPKLIAAWQAQREARRQALDAICARSGRRAWHLGDRFDASALSAHLLSP